MPNLSPGLTATLTQPVTEEKTANYLRSGTVPVFATPALILLIEQACVAALTNHLSTEQTSVGTALNVNHLAATPLGMTVTATITLVAIEGRQLTFDVSARDEVEDIARGSHTRVLVNTARFLQKATAKVA